MIKQDQLNQITTELLIVWTCLRGWIFFENDSVESDCMEDIVDSGCRENSDVDEAYDQQIVLNHSTRGYFLK